MVHFYIPVYTTSHILMLRKDYTSSRSDSASQNFFYTDGLDYFNTFNRLKELKLKKNWCQKGEEESIIVMPAFSRKVTKLRTRPKGGETLDRPLAKD